MLDDLKRHKNLITERGILVDILAALDRRREKAKRIAGKKIPGHTHLVGLYRGKVAKIDKQLYSIETDLAKLPETASEPLRMRYIAGMEIAAMAEKMSYSPRSVNRILREAEALYERKGSHAN